MSSIARAVVAVACLSAAFVACRPSTQPPADPNLPVIFVHGLMGSGSQYRSQALRWASNGVDPNRIKVFNYNTAVTDASKLNAFVDSVRSEFGVSKVNLVGHSLGTAVVTGYVSAQSAKVARFVLVDGVGCPSGNNCLAIRAANMGQTHVESSISAESFDQQYRFFTGKAPTTTAITPTPGPVSISGFALALQTNNPSAGVQGQVWEVDSATGQRVGSAPTGAFTVRADGSWGPVTVDNGKHYEITSSRGDMSAHYYFEPFVRSDRNVHLITTPQGGAQDTNTNRGPNHVVMVVQRQREFWRSHGARNDVLRVTAGGQTANVFQNVTTDVIGVHMFDDTATPRVSSLGLLNYFRSQAFQTGVDVYIPASADASGTVAVADTYRGDAGKVQRINVPNWPSSGHHVIIEFNDYA
jgi:pimeloyl-ACP methyl ester carboxylesterase